MVKLDVSLLRYMSKDDFRVLTAIEMGMRNHELVPKSLVYSISGITNGSVSKILLNLAQNKLISYERGKRYDGYRLTYAGYDYLALNVLRTRDVISSVGHQIGVGKESDVYVASNDEGRSFAIKFHRLGRTCFRKVSEKRDYQKKNQNHKAASWIYLSRLAAMREFAFMKLLYERKILPVPEPIEINRHCIVMELINGVILNQISAEQLNEEVVRNLFDKLMAMIIKLTNEFGVVHGDFNEFNILIKLDGSYEPVLIDFPQMIPVDHELAEEYFERDVNCIVDFFAKRFHFESETIPVFEPLNRDTNDDLHNLVVALDDTILENDSEIKKICDFNTANEPRFKDGKSELLSKFLSSLPNGEDLTNPNVNEGLYYNKESQNFMEQTQEKISYLDKCLENMNIKPTNSETKIENDVESISNVCPSGENNTISNEFDQKSQYSDVCSTATTFSPREIKSRLMKENRKNEIKQRIKVNPKKIKGDANAMRRKKKDNQKSANEDLKAYVDDRFW